MMTRVRSLHRRVSVIVVATLLTVFAQPTKANAATCSTYFSIPHQPISGGPAPVLVRASAIYGSYTGFGLNQMPSTTNPPYYPVGNFIPALEQSNTDGLVYMYVGHNYGVLGSVLYLPDSFFGVVYHC